MQDDLTRLKERASKLASYSKKIPESTSMSESSSHLFVLKSSKLSDANQSLAKQNLAFTNQEVKPNNEQLNSEQLSQDRVQSQIVDLISPKKDSSPDLRSGKKKQTSNIKD